MAAGKGKRMKSDLPKVLHKLGGRPLVHHVIELAREVGSERIILVIGHGREQLRSETSRFGIEYAVQERQLGTGDAVNVCRGMLTGYDGDVLILSGDVPMLTAASVERAFRLHRETAAKATVFTFKPVDAHGYGRIVRGANGGLLRIVEHKDAAGEVLDIEEMNAGIYLFHCPTLLKALESLSNNNAAGEYYITDTIDIIRQMRGRVSAYLVQDPLEVAGVNNRKQLDELETLFIGKQ